MADRLLFNSLSPPPVNGGEYMDNVAEKFGMLFDAMALKPASVTNSGNDYTITIDPVLEDDVKPGMGFYIQPSATNTGAVRLRVTSGNPYYDVVKATGQSLAEGEFDGDTVYFVVFVGGDFRILSVASADADAGAKAYFQEFLVSGNWTKPEGISPNAIVIVDLWAGGGGGSSASPGGGGGGGAFNRGVFKASDLSSVVAVTIGNGGAVGAAGGNSAFGSVLTAFGGGGGTTASAGAGGGGSTSAGGNASGSTGGNGGRGGGGGNSASGIGAYGAGGGGNSASGGDAVFGGGGGSGSGTSGSYRGGDSVYGGGGGAGSTASGGGGQSTFGGAGGNANQPGTVPGGGGGRNAIGAAGKCIVRVVG